MSALIHLYSIGYMHDDPDFPKFFLYLNLFVASMLLLVLADNLLFAFVGWEGVGVCSYWLISFWFGRDKAASAGQKAFLYNRLADVGFLVAIFLVFSKTGTLDYLGIFSHIRAVDPAARAPPSPSCSSRPLAASPRSCLCSRGSPTPWRARPPSPPSSTRRRW